MEAFDSFFAKGGSKTLKVFYQEGEAPGIGKFLAILIQGDMIVPFIINFFNVSQNKIWFYLFIILKPFAIRTENAYFECLR